MTSKIQSVVFQKDRFTLPEAKKWLKENNMYTLVDKKPTLWRFRLLEPKKFKRFVTKKVEPGLNLVIGIKK